MTYHTGRVKLPELIEGRWKELSTRLFRLENCRVDASLFPVENSNLNEHP